MADRIGALLFGSGVISFGKKVLNVSSTIWSDNKGLDRLTYFLSAVIWQIRKRLGKPFIAKLPNGARVKVYPSASYSGIFYARWLDSKDVHFLRRNARLSATFVDVGANVGLISALLFDKFSNFYLFEPAKTSFHAMEETCALNPSVNCKPMNIAIADIPGELEFFDEGDFSTTSRAFNLTTTNDARIVRVPVDTLDNLLVGKVSDLVLKVDVEGLEERVFLGAANLFQTKTVKLVLFERLGRTDFDRIKAFFDKMGYVIFFVDEAGTIVRDDVVVRTPLINLFACPQTDFSLLQV